MDEAHEISLKEHQRYWLKHVRVVDPVMDSKWRIQLPNGVSVSFAGSIDAATLATVLSTAAVLD